MHCGDGKDKANANLVRAKVLQRREFDGNILNCHNFEDKFKILLLLMATSLTFSSGNVNLYTMQTILNKREGPVFHEEVIFNRLIQGAHRFREKVI